MLRVFLSASAVFATLALPLTMAHAQTRPCDDLSVGHTPPALLAQSVRPNTAIVCRRVYIAMQSLDARVPLWSAEHLTDEALDSAQSLGRVTKFFHPEAGLPYGQRAELADYRGSGLDRGHLTPSGDAPDQLSQEETFSLANVVPETPALNEGVWTGIEMAVADWAHRVGELYVVTGPVLQANGPTIGWEHIPVPVAIWKAVYDPVHERGGAWLCRNDDAPVCDTLSFAALEQRIGIDPFPSLSLQIHDADPALPQPEISPYTPRSRSTGSERRALIDPMLRGFSRRF